MEIRDLLLKMKAKKASDIHFKVGMKPIIRKNKHLFLLDKDIKEFSNKDIQRLVEPLLDDHLKKMYNLNKTVEFGRYFEGVGRCRFCLFSQKGTFRMVARLIPDAIPTIPELGLPPILIEIAKNKTGLILITGATGAGKSTTAASILNYINHHYSYHIITIEDPIEYVLRDHTSCITQRELSLDYNDPTLAFKSTLRQDPDVIFFGELRDQEIISTALKAAESGHLVVSTLHSSASTDAIERLISYFEGPQQENARIQIADSLRAIISQRLVPSKEKRLIPICEVLINNSRMQQALIEKKNSQHIRQIIESSNDNWGMQSFDQHIMQLISTGLLSEKEGVRYAFNPENIQMMIQGFNSQTAYSQAFHSGSSISSKKSS